MERRARADRGRRDRVRDQPRRRRCCSGRAARGSAAREPRRRVRDERRLRRRRRARQIIDGRARGLRAEVRGRGLRGSTGSTMPFVSTSPSARPRPGTTWRGRVLVAGAARVRRAAQSLVSLGQMADGDTRLTGCGANLDGEVHACALVRHARRRTRSRDRAVPPPHLRDAEGRRRLIECVREGARRPRRIGRIHPRDRSRVGEPAPRLRSGSSKRASAKHLRAAVGSTT